MHEIDYVPLILLDNNVTNATAQVVKHVEACGACLPVLVCPSHLLAAHQI